MAGAAGSRTTRKKKTAQRKTSTTRTTKKKSRLATAKTKAKTTRGKAETSPVKPSKKKTRAASPRAREQTRKPERPAESRVSEEILGELRSLRSLMEASAAGPVAADAALDDSVLSLRRLLNELIEKRMEAVTATLAEMRASLLSEESDLQRATEQLDRLLDELGVVRFDAEAMVYPDPLIHAVVGERSDPSAPDGVVLETLDPGLRAGRGSILARARVVVNRRP